MLDTTAIAIHLVEKGWVPDAVVRLGIRHLLRSKIKELDGANPDSAEGTTQAFVEAIKNSPLALVPEKANEQHYEVPAQLFSAVLGPHLKYSCGYWPDPTTQLAESESLALQLTCEHAGLSDGQSVLELGCGWGSLSLWMASNYPNSHITALSNSNSQRAFIQSVAKQRNLTNLEILTQDFNRFDTSKRFDRIVSIEMFEHLRNWRLAFKKVSQWLEPQGRFFMHVFVNHEVPYSFDIRDSSDWMAKYFFSGGMMPSEDLALQFQDDLKILNRWRWSGTHYARTAEAWLSNMDNRKSSLMPLFRTTYGDDASMWWVRWRLFFMSVSELFGYRDGQQWWVSHYLFEKRP